MKKILTLLLAGLAYQSTAFAEVQIKLSVLTDAAGKDVVSTVLLDNDAAFDPAKISGITEADLVKAITDGTKVPLYTKTDVPYGWGDNGAQTLALFDGGQPNPNACYIQGDSVYNSDGSKIGTYKATLITASEASTSGSKVAANSSGSNLYLRITENNGAGNAAVSAFIYFSAASLAGALITDVPECQYDTFRQASLPDDYFLQVYVTPA